MTACVYVHTKHPPTDAQGGRRRASTCSPTIISPAKHQSGAGRPCRGCRTAEDALLCVRACMHAPGTATQQHSAASSVMPAAIAPAPLHALKMVVRLRALQRRWYGTESAVGAAVGAGVDVGRPLSINDTPQVPSKQGPGRACKLQGAFVAPDGLEPGTVALPVRCLCALRVAGTSSCCSLQLATTPEQFAAGLQTTTTISHPSHDSPAPSSSCCRCAEQRCWPTASPRRTA